MRRPGVSGAAAGKPLIIGLLVSVMVLQVHLYFKPCPPCRERYLQVKQSQSQQSALSGRGGTAEIAVHAKVEQSSRPSHSEDEHDDSGEKSPHASNGGSDGSDGDASSQAANAPVEPGKECGDHGKLLRVKTKPPYFICVYPTSDRDLISLTLEEQGVWAECAAYLRSAARLHNSTRLRVVDVGANIGACAMYFAANGAHVTAFEPLRSNYQLLQRSSRLNPTIPGSVTVIPAGAAAKESEATIFTESMNRGNSVVTKNADALPKSRSGSKWVRDTVQLVRVDSKVDPTTHVHLMKIDCQGHELEALKGATGLFGSNAVDMIVFELDLALLQSKGVSPKELFSFLEEHGFNVKTPTGERLYPSQFGSYARQGNYIAFRKEFTHWSDGKALYPNQPRQR